MTELDIRFDRLPAMRVAHVSVKSASPEGEAIGKIMAWAQSQGIQEGYRLFGYDNCQPHPKHIYTTWITVGPDVEASGDIGIKDVPGGRCAIVRVTGVEQISPTWRQLEKWARDNGHQMGSLPGLEEIISPPDTPEDQVQLDLYLSLAE